MLHSSTKSVCETQETMDTLFDSWKSYGDQPGRCEGQLKDKAIVRHSPHGFVSETITLVASSPSVIKYSAWWMKGRQ